jgi:hypothetical protein
MNSIRRMIMIGTIAFAITVSSTIWSNTASADIIISIDELEAHKMLNTDNIEIEEDLHHVLGFDSEEEFNEAIYNHESLAEVAENQQVDVQKIIALQSSQLMDQMDERLAKGYLTLHEYGALTAEIPEIIRKSVYGETI